ncbi:MAG: ABC transporter substrate-binding protein, partial [Deltaproteobacteria bacterium]|nr:ABC transporter substrate-binding protein [Deltaproteobacteria bacterium]
MACLAALLGLVAPVQAQTRQRPQVTISYQAMTSSYVPLWLADELGLFERHGVPVRLVFVGAALGVPALLAGDVDVVVQPTIQTIRARLGGVDIKIVQSNHRRQYGAIVAGQGIQTLADLKRRRVGISRYGTVSDMAARYVLQQVGLRPGVDVQILQLGSVPEIAAGLAARVIDAGYLSPPSLFQAARFGVKELVDLRKLDVPFQMHAVATLSPILARKRETLLRIVRAHSEAQYLVKAGQRREEAIRATGRFTKVTDLEVLRATYEYMRPLYELPPYTRTEDIEGTIHLAGIAREFGRQLEGERMRSAVNELIENGLVRQLEQEGFFARLAARAH